LLQAANRLAEAVPLMRRIVEIFLKFNAATGHPHPHLQTAQRNCAGLLQAMDHSDVEVLQELTDLLPKYGMSL
jgi:hypothetical protein